MGKYKELSLNLNKVDIIDILLTLALIIVFLILFKALKENEKLSIEVVECDARYNELNYQYEILDKEYKNVKNEYENLIERIRTSDKYNELNKEEK